MLNNQKALQLLLGSYTQFSNNDISAIISTKMKILAITDLSANIYLQKKEKLVGKHMFNYFRKDVTLAERGANLLRKVIQDKRVIEVISINFQRVKGYVILLAKYTPIVNADTSDVIAIKSEARQIDHPIRWYKLPQIIHTNHISEDNHLSLVEPLSAEKPIQLTVIEEQIMFLLFQCSTYDDIAYILSLRYNKDYQPVYVGQVVRRNLFKKFNVVNVEALKSIGANLGYHKNIPTSLTGELLLELSSL